MMDRGEIHPGPTIVRSANSHPAHTSCGADAIDTRIRSLRNGPLTGTRKLVVLRATPRTQPPF